MRTTLLLQVLGWASFSVAMFGFVSHAEAYSYGEMVTVVLKDGTEISGELIEETDGKIRLKTDFGVTQLERARIKEIVRGKNPFQEEFDRRLQAAKKQKSAQGLVDLVTWSADKGFDSQRQALLEQAVDYDKNHEAARRLLGHGRFEGTWVDAKRVKELLASGYVWSGINLVKGSSDTPKPPGAKDGNSSRPRKGVTAVGRPPERELTEKEKSRMEREQKRHEKALEKQREQRQREMDGVPWEDAYRIRGPFVTLVCNSTQGVAKTYGGIVTEIYKALRTFITGKFIRAGKPTVFIYKTQAEFMERTGMSRNVGGFYQPANEQVHAYHGGFGTTASTLSVLAHEVTHQFQGKMLGGRGMRFLPKWVIEGMAVYLGDGSKLDYKKKKLITHLIPRDRLFHIQRKMRNNTHSKLRELCMLNQGFTGSHYADSWSLLYYLFKGPKKSKGQKFFVEYWLRGTERAIRRSDFTELSDKYFGGMDKLEKEWVEFTLALQPEPAGEIDGSEWVSEEFGCELSLPWNKWEWDPVGNSSSVLVGMKVPDTSARAELRFLNNNDNVGTREFFEKLKERYFEHGEDFKVTSSKVGALDGLKATFRLPPPPEEDEEKADDKPDGEDKGGESGGPKDAEKPAEEKPPTRRFEVYVVVTVTTAYVIIGQAEESEFDEWQPDFGRIARSFRLSTDNRRW